MTSCRAVRVRLSAVGAVGGAGILVLGLVTAPPDSNNARTEIRTLRLSAFTRPLATPPREFLRIATSAALLTVVPVASAVPGDAADITAGKLLMPLAFSSTKDSTPEPEDPVTNRQDVTDNAAVAVPNNAALAVPNNAAVAVPAAVLDPINAVLGPILAFAFLALLFGVLLPAGYLVGQFYRITEGWSPLSAPLALSGVSVATAEANATSDPTLMNESPVSDSAPVATAKEGLSEAASTAETERVTSMKHSARAEQVSTSMPTSTKDVTETAASDEASTETTSAPASSASASTSESAKPAGRRATPRPVVRHSLDGGEQLGDLGHRRNGGHPTTRRVAVNDEAAGPSSVTSSPAASSSKGSGSASGDPSGDDSADS
jgi:hypothetical protein